MVLVNTCVGSTSSEKVPSSNNHLYAVARWLSLVNTGVKGEQAAGDTEKEASELGRVRTSREASVVHANSLMAVASDGVHHLHSRISE